MPPLDIPNPPPRGAYKTTDYQMTCPECRQLVWAHYEVPADGPGRAVLHVDDNHKPGCTLAPKEDKGP